MYDMVIRNAVIYDGTGAPGYEADLAIKGDRIAAIGQIPMTYGGPSIDAAGKTVTPGFIDPHTHADLDVLFAPELISYVKQGVTTVVTGNCGYGMAPQGEEVFYTSIPDQRFIKSAEGDFNDPANLFYERKKAQRALKEVYNVDLDWYSFAEFNEKCRKLPLGINLAPLVGYSAVRTAVMGRDCLREATSGEVEKLVSEVEKAMTEGAFGLSSGRDPIYRPGPYAGEAEMIAVLKSVAKHKCVFSSHTYNSKGERVDRIGGYQEMFRQARAAGVKANVSHVHVLNMASNEREAVKAVQQTLALFDEEKAKGLDLSFDVIPSATSTDYTHGSFGFFFKPLILMCGTREKLGKQLKDKTFRSAVLHKVRSGEMMPYFDSEKAANWFGELVLLKHRNQNYCKKTLLDIARELDQEPLETTMNLFAEDPDMIADFAMPDTEITTEMFCARPEAMPCSDGSSYAKETNLMGDQEMPMYPNAMNISYIPRYLTHYGKHNFAQAVHKASGLVAERFGINNRGEIKVGNYADFVIMNQDELHSYDTITGTLKDPEGIEYVFVNGKMAVCNKQVTQNHGGYVLRKESI